MGYNARRARIGTLFTLTAALLLASGASVSASASARASADTQSQATPPVAKASPSGDSAVPGSDLGPLPEPSWRRQGPLPIEDFFSLSMGFLRLTPAAPRQLEPGEWELSVVAGVGNDFAQSGAVEEFLGSVSDRQLMTVETLRTIEPTPGADGLYRIDLEYYTTTLSVARGFRSGARVDVSVPILDIEGGSLDRTIEGFHDLFGLDQAGRTKVPRRQTAIYLRSSDMELILDEEVGKSLGDARVTLSYPLRPRLGLAGLSFRGTVKLPTGSDRALVSSGSLDVGLQLLGEVALGRSRTYTSLGAIYLGEHSTLALDDQWVFSGSLGWERPMKKRWNLVSQLSIATSPYSDLGLPELDPASIEVTIGARLPLKHGQFFFGVTENVLHFNNSSDIGISFGLSHSIGRFKRR